MSTLVYLACLVAGQNIQVTLDEERQAATILFPRYSLSNRLDAIFQPNQVLIDGDLVSYTINRTDLTIEQQTHMLLTKRKTDTGVCQIMPTPSNRQF